MAERMNSKFDKYWGMFENLNMLLVIAVVLDPRYKMKYVNFILGKSYDSLSGRLKSDLVVGVLNHLYDRYDSLLEASNDDIGGDTSTMSEAGDAWQSQWEKHLEE
ncbi:zinc finger BED domain-containing protein RICESLEEPER 3-like [Nicotiana tomentosiformis]|uniref:zinc finger BED domain-containing protein RICESLEEPER 3-like n=1 Tax=Nicotiana tomentosiformis TaxID=4098 RepID=UPI00051BAB1F|nr:zinc finger BED domain-containing protein RICESLEEPER 3-like [Nicotiana tomentosiformis]